MFKDRLENIWFYLKPIADDVFEVDRWHIPLINPQLYNEIVYDDVVELCSPDNGLILQFYENHPKYGMCYIAYDNGVNTRICNVDNQIDFHYGSMECFWDAMRN